MPAKIILSGMMVFMITLGACAHIPGVSQLTGSGGEYGKAWGVEAKCDVILNWVSHFNPSHFFTGHNPKLYAILYRDEYFEPVFGTTFPEMSKFSREATYKSVSTCFRSRPYTQSEKLRPYQNLLMPLAGGITAHLYADIPKLVLAYRKTSQSRDEALHDMQTMKATKENYSKVINYYKDFGEYTLDDFWPEEKKEFLAVVEATRRRLAPDAYVSFYDSAISEATNYEGLIKLQNIQWETQELREFVAQKVIKEKESRAQQVLNDSLRRFLDDEWKNFEKRGTGLEGVEKGLAWYRDIETRYLKVFDFQPSLLEMEARFTKARQEDLTKEADAIIGRLNQTGTLKDLESVRTELVGIPADFGGEGGKKVSEWIKERVAIMQFDEQKWRFSKSELALMSQTGIMNLPEAYDPPTAEDIRFALLRAIEKTGGRILTAHSATLATPSLEDMLPFGTAFGVASIPGIGTFRLPNLPNIPLGKVHIEDVEVEDCQPAQKSGYQCRYNVNYDLENFAGRLFIPQGNFDEFTLTHYGWRSETASQRLLGAATNVFGNMAKDFSSALPRPGCAGMRRLTDPGCR